MRKIKRFFGVLLVTCVVGTVSAEPTSEEMVAEVRATFESRAGTRPLFVASAHDDATQRPILGISHDGIDFRKIAPFNFTPPPGDGCRDCSLLFWKGKYYMAYTAGNFGYRSYFGIAVSEDLVNWSHHVDVPTIANGADYTWAPEWCVDGSDVYVTYAKPNEVGRWLLYYVKATDAGLTQWTSQSLIGGVNDIASEIDAHVSRFRHSWLLVCRHYSGNGAFIYRSDTSPVGGYSLMSSVDWGGTQEGQFLANMGGGKLRLYFINAPGHPGAAMSFADSLDGGLTFGAISPITGDFITPHMSVFGFTADSPPELKAEIAGEIKVSYSSMNNFIMETSQDLSSWKTVTPSHDSLADEWRITQPVGEEGKRFWRLRKPY